MIGAIHRVVEPASRDAVIARWHYYRANNTRINEDKVPLPWAGSYWTESSDRELFEKCLELFKNYRHQGGCVN
jgi:hypothetical protein